MCVHFFVRQVFLVSLISHNFQLISCKSLLRFNYDPENNTHLLSHREKRQDSKQSYIDRECDYYYRLDLERTLELTSPNYKTGNYYPGLDCTWTVLGAPKCIPVISCDDFNLRDNNCEDELLITDGIGGRLSVCGDEGIDEPTRATNGTRDLFIKFRTKKDNNFGKTYKGFKCKVVCSKKSDSPVPIPFATLKQIEESKCACGIHAEDKQGRVIGGSNAGKKDMPWQVALVNPGTREPFCGGSILNNRFILTAAHCFWFAKKPAEEVEVLVSVRILDSAVMSDDASKDKELGQKGSLKGPGYNLKSKTDKDENTQRFKVTKIMMHPFFNEKYDFDVAILRLDSEINFFVPNPPSPICLPEPGNYDDFDGAKPFVSGWGLADENAGGSTRILQKLEVPVISLSECSQALPGTITDRMLCAGYMEGKKDACSGDSGGPLSLKLPNKHWIQVGIVSWGEGCARKKKPGIYTRVTEFTQWIIRHSNEPGTKWCKKNTDASDKRKGRLG